MISLEPVRTDDSNEPTSNGPMSSASSDKSTVLAVSVSLIFLFVFSLMLSMACVAACSRSERKYVFSALMKRNTNSLASKRPAVCVLRISMSEVSRGNIPAMCLRSEVVRVVGLVCGAGLICMLTADLGSKRRWDVAVILCLGTRTVYCTLLPATTGLVVVMMPAVLIKLCWGETTLMFEIVFQTGRESRATVNTKTMAPCNTRNGLYEMSVSCVLNKRFWVSAFWLREVIILLYLEDMWLRLLVTVFTVFAMRWSAELGIFFSFLCQYLLV